MTIGGKGPTSDEVSKLQDYLKSEYPKMIEGILKQIKTNESLLKQIQAKITTFENGLREHRASIDAIEGKVVDKNSEAIEEKFKPVQVKMTAFEKKLGEIEKSIAAIEDKVVEKNSKAIEEKFKTVQDKMTAFEEKLEPITGWS